MDIIGMWKIAEVNVMGQDFKQTWRTVEDVNADASVNPMQKVMAQAVYLFEQDGTFKQLMPKEIAGGEGEPYDDKYVVGHVGKWKEDALFVKEYGMKAGKRKRISSIRS